MSPAWARPTSLSLMGALWMLLTAAGAWAETPLAPSRNAPVDVSARTVAHDDAAQTLTASGDVEIVQDGRILKAEEVVYDLAADKVVARGNVVLTDTNGDVHFFDEIALSNAMKDGFVRGLRSLLKDGSRFTAQEGQRQAGTKLEMRHASYTPCEPCKTDPTRPPVWDIRAQTVTHDEVARTVSYENATFDVLGMPVLWVPYFSHADGSVKRKSGFLSPKLGWNSDLGGMVMPRYYWSIAPDRDATFGTMLTTRQNPVLTGEYRQRWENARLKTSASVTHSGRTDHTGGVDVARKDELRGHLFADGLWALDERWRAGTKLELSSDDQYLRQYDFGDRDVLENEVYVERFSGRDYGVGRLLAFQDTRVQEEKVDQPDVLPEVLANFLGEPDSLAGGRWSVETGILGLRRDGTSGQDRLRLSAKTGWNRRFESDTGLLAVTDLSVRADAYHTIDRPTGPALADDSDSRGRVVPIAHTLVSFPLVKPGPEADVTLEPLAALTLVPRTGDNDTIPNEDSQDAQVDASNLFNPDRFPGMDRVEDRSRVTYGLRTGLHGHEGSRIDGFLGQSTRFEDDSASFPRGSGLDDRQSDIVGQISGVYDSDYALDYRFQIGGQTLTSVRHEIDARGTFGPLEIGSRYLFSDPLEGTSIDESREQVQGSTAWRVSDRWRLRTAALHDLGQDPGLRKANFGMDYMGQCVNFSATATRTLTRDSSGDSGTEIMFRIGLKNLGEFQTSGFSLTPSSE